MSNVIEKAEGVNLGWLKVRGFKVPYNRTLGVGQYFSNLILSRISKEKPCNVVWTGEPGISKTYSAIMWARYLQPKTFGIKNICMTYTEFMKNMINLDKGEIIVFDEPEYEAGHQEWYDSQNRALTSTMRSGRFKVHPIFLPVINKKLLNKVIRENLIQFMVNMIDRGEGTVYRFSPSQFIEKVYTSEICNLRIGLLDGGVCKERWCPDCPDFDTCELLRAQYERKRNMIQNTRYKDDLKLAETAGRKKASFGDELVRAYDMRERLKVSRVLKTTGEEKISYSVEKIELILGVSPNMAQKIRMGLQTFSREEIDEYRTATEII